MYYIGRPINGISLNGREYILDADDNVMKFKSKQDACDFLHANGATEEIIEAEGIEILDEDELPIE